MLMRHLGCCGVELGRGQRPGRSDGYWCLGTPLLKIEPFRVGWDGAPPGERSSIPRTNALILAKSSLPFCGPPSSRAGRPHLQSVQYPDYVRRAKAPTLRG